MKIQNASMVDSWKRVCPDYEVIGWSSLNYDYGKRVS